MVRLSSEERSGSRRCDFWGQAPGAVAAEGAYPAEGGRVGCGRRLERQLDLRDAGHQLNNIGRLRRRLVEEGLEGALKRKHNPNSARPRIFDGAAEAKLIALTCSPAPEGSPVGAFDCSRRSSN